MLITLAVAALDLGIVEGGPDDGRAEIVEDDAAGDAAEELEGGAVQSPPGRARLVEDEFGVLVPAARQRHHEHPRPTELVSVGVEELTGRAKVHLGLLPRGDLDP